jgi:hypothetical protein
MRRNLPEERRKVRELLDQGMSARAAGKLVNVATSTVLRWYPTEGRVAAPTSEDETDPETDDAQGDLDDGDLEEQEDAMAEPQGSGMQAMVPETRQVPLSVAPARLITYQVESICDGAWARMFDLQLPFAPTQSTLESHGLIAGKYRIRPLIDGRTPDDSRAFVLVLAGMPEAQESGGLAPQGHAARPVAPPVAPAAGPSALDKVTELIAAMAAQQAEFMKNLMALEQQRTLRTEAPAAAQAQRVEPPVRSALELEDFKAKEQRDEKARQRDHELRMKQLDLESSERRQLLERALAPGAQPSLDVNQKLLDLWMAAQGGKKDEDSVGEATRTMLHLRVLEQMDEMSERRRERDREAKGSPLEEAAAGTLQAAGEAIATRFAGGGGGAGAGGAASGGGMIKMLIAKAKKDPDMRKQFLLAIENDKELQELMERDLKEIADKIEAGKAAAGLDPTPPAGGADSGDGGRPLRVARPAAR